MIYHIGFILTVAIHYIILVGVVVSAPFLLLHEPWYVSLPLLAWITNLPVLRSPCPLTSLENYFRDKLGKPRILGFVKHWVLFKRKL